MSKLSWLILELVNLSVLIRGQARYRFSQNLPTYEGGIVTRPDFDVNRRHVRRMVLQSEKLAASVSVRAVLDGLARHGCEIAQEVATRSSGRASFLSTCDTRSNSCSTFDSADRRKCSREHEVISDIRL